MNLVQLTEAVGSLLDMLGQVIRGLHGLLTRRQGLQTSDLGPRGSRQRKTRLLKTRTPHAGPPGTPRHALQGSLDTNRSANEQRLGAAPTGHL